MSILIKDMDMPIGCFDCDFCSGMIVGRDDCYHCECPVEGITGRNITAFVEQELEEMAPFVPAWCPLVEIPKGVRLIDANKISSDMDDMKVEGEVFVTAVNYVKLIVNDAPTIFEDKKGAGK